jgi:predicted nucleic acid-binding protein
VSLFLADTSVWVAHFRSGNPMLQSLVAMDQVLCHPLIVLELACGTPPAPRERTLGDLKKLQQAVVAATDEILALIERDQFHDSACGAIDMALLACVLLTPDTLLWTIDKNLDALGARLGVAFSAASR